MTAKNASVTLDDVPRRVDTDLSKERYQPGQKLGDPTSDGRRVDVLQSAVPDALRQPEQLVYDFGSYDAAVVIE